MRLDTLPALVRLGSAERVNNCRVLVDDDGRALVLHDEGRGVVTVLARARVEVERAKGRNWTLTTTDGEVWQVQSSGGCGCGSPLKTANVLQLIESGDYG